MIWPDVYRWPSVG